MILIGYWIESIHDDTYCPPQELVGPLPGDVRREVADYLDAGQVYQGYRGHSWCRFGCNRAMGSRELSDGFWAWPEDLGHYVRDHGIILPDEFIVHVRAHCRRIHNRQWEDDQLETNFWIAWCRTHASGAYRRRIEEARRQSRLYREEVFAAQVAALEAEEGLSDHRCQWSGCNNRALLHRALCAACCLEKMESFVCSDAPGHDIESILREPPPTA